MYIALFSGDLVFHCVVFTLGTVQLYAPITASRWELLDRPNCRSSDEIHSSSVVDFEERVTDPTCL